MSKVYNVTTAGGRRMTRVGPARGKVIAKRGGGVAGADLVSAVVTLGAEAAATMRLVSEQRTVRRRIEAWEAAEIARLQESGQRVRDLLAMAYGERQVALVALVNGVESAVAAQDTPALVALLESMVTLLEKTPLSQLADLDSVASKLGDPDAVWRI